MESNESDDSQDPYGFDHVECLESISLEFDEEADSATLTERYNLEDEPVSPHAVAGEYEGVAQNTDGGLENESVSADTAENVFILRHTRTDISEQEGKMGPIYLLLSGVMANSVDHDPDAAEEWFEALKMQVHEQLHD